MKSYAQFNEASQPATPLTPSQLAAMKKLQNMAKKDGTFETELSPSGRMITKTGINTTTLGNLIDAKYLSAKELYRQGVCVGLKILKKV